MKKSIIVSGASGFVGLNFIRNVANVKDFEIYKLGRHKNNDSVKELIYSDLESHQLGFHHYVHLAGKAHDTDYLTSRDCFFEANYDLTCKLYDTFLNDSTAEKFIFISSIAAVGSSSNNPINEEVSPNPNGYYGESKREAEIYILKNLPIDKNKFVYILRSPMIHGPGNKGNLNLLYSIVNKGIPWPLGKYNNKRSFLSIENFCFVINEILNGGITQGVYHLADDEPLSTNQVVEMISEELGRKPRILNIPKSIIQFGAKLGNKLPLPLNEKRLEKLTENYLVSNKKIVSEMGKALPVSARDGMRKTIQSFNK